jgi:hypothetical protein
MVDPFHAVDSYWLNTHVLAINATKLVRLGGKKIQYILTNLTRKEMGTGNDNSDVGIFQFSQEANPI